MLQFSASSFCTQLHTHGVKLKGRPAYKLFRELLIQCTLSVFIIWYISLHVGKCWKCAPSPVRHAWYHLYRLLEIVWSSYPKIADSMCLIISILCVCVWIVLVSVVTLDCYTEKCHVVSDQTSEEATINDTSFGPKKCFVRWPLNYWLYGQLHNLTGRARIPAPCLLN